MFSRTLASNTCASCGISVVQAPRSRRPRQADAVDLDMAVLRLVEAGQHAHQRALARAARADQRDALAAIERQRHVVQAAARLVVGRLAAGMLEMDAAHVDALPAAGGGAGQGLAPGLDAAGRLVAQRRLPDGVGARQVGAHAQEVLQVAGQRAGHAAGLLGVLVDHEHAADQHRAAGARLPGVDRHQQPDQQHAGQVDRAPLPFAEHDAAAQRHRHSASRRPSSRRVLSCRRRLITVATFESASSSADA